uniref:Thymidine kinase n=1 Tax=Canarypox virus TaxID=44088 RepID=Q9W922_CNPV|nr:thymidine kinase [Canarypox virus]BAA77564.1 thymidine kinase [Canarypox virus]
MATGEIRLIIGPMFSGKTTELVRLIRRFMISGRKCIIIKHCSDSRYTEGDLEAIYTHDKISMEALSCSKLLPLIPKIDNFEVIGIDEGQFFEDIVEFSEIMANKGKTVIIAALNGDFKRQLFGNIFKLLSLSESVTSLTAICAVCKNEASFSKRMTDDKDVKVIGGKEMYTAVCRKCFL